MQQVTEQKKALRRTLRSKRSGISAEILAERSLKIAENLTSLDVYCECELLLVFISTSGEIDTSPLIRRAFSDKKLVAAPRCGSGGSMDFFRIDSLNDLEKGAYGIYEPKAHCPAAGNTCSALCVVPGLAFDESGARIGYGGGYYDRFLAGFEGFSCGVCLDEMILDPLPCEDTDMRVKAVVTESRII